MSRKLIKEKGFLPELFIKQNMFFSGKKSSSSSSSSSSSPQTREQQTQVYDIRQLLDDNHPLKFETPLYITPTCVFQGIKISLEQDTVDHGNAANINFQLAMHEVGMFLTSSFHPGPIPDDKLEVVLNLDAEDEKVVEQDASFVESVDHIIRETLKNALDDPTGKQRDLVLKTFPHLKKGIENYLPTWPKDSAVKIKFKCGDKQPTKLYQESPNGKLEEVSLASFKDVIAANTSFKTPTFARCVVHVTGVTINDKGVYPTLKLWTLVFTAPSSLSDKKSNKKARKA